MRESLVRQKREERRLRFERFRRAGLATAAAGKAQRSAPSRVAVMARARAADDAVIATLKVSPAMRTGEIVKATGARTSTTGERLRRLRQKGLIERSGDGWTAVSTT
jgi:hypothetical protein